jgi:hypothetical protein
MHQTENIFLAAVKEREREKWVIVRNTTKAAAKFYAHGALERTSQKTLLPTILL